jgi:LacI family transcriptional regulator
VDIERARTSRSPRRAGGIASGGGKPGVPTARSAARAGRPTIFDVAKVAGVSYSTVSRVVNGYVHVSPEARLRVQTAMRDLGYVAHIPARSLASGRTNAIGLLVVEVESSFFTMVIKGVDQQVAAADYDLLLCTTHRRREKEAEYVARLSHGMVDGLLIILPGELPDYVERLRAGAFPFVLIDYDDVAPGCNVVNASNRRGAREAIEHLIGLGHRHIGFITGRPEVGAAQERLAGYRDAMTAAGLPVHEDDVVAGDFLEARGYLAARELLARPDRPTAVFASSDAAAFGVLRAARDAGLRVPHDLSVVGFDDIPEASYVGSPLTTVRQPLHEMGRLAVRRLLSLMAEPDQPPARIVLETELVVRESTAPIAGWSAGSCLARPAGRPRRPARSAP